MHPTSIRGRTWTLELRPRYQWLVSGGISTGIFSQSYSRHRYPGHQDANFEMYEAPRDRQLRAVAKVRQYVDVVGGAPLSWDSDSDGRISAREWN